jgi:hypothetical protein
MTAEEIRLDEACAGTQSWRRWGPYVSERQWGTVREDYSADGSAWEYFTHGGVAKLIHQYAEYALQRSSPNAIEQEAVITERGANPPAP